MARERDLAIAAIRHLPPKGFYYIVDVNHGREGLTYSVRIPPGLGRLLPPEPGRGSPLLCVEFLSSWVG